MIKNCTNQYAYSVEYIKQHCEVGGMFNESIIAGLSDGGVASDSAALALIIAATFGCLWFASIVVRFIWAFVDDSKMAWIDEEAPQLDFEVVFFIPVGGFVLLTPIIIVLHYPYVWITASILIFLMFVARYGRRTHKALQEHIKDKNVHKED